MVDRCVQAKYITSYVWLCLAVFFAFMALNIKNVKCIWEIGIDMQALHNQIVEPRNNKPQYKLTSELLYFVCGVLRCSMNVPSYEKC